MDRSYHQRARDAMVSGQLVSRGISDERVLAAMRKVPRHVFIPEDQQDSAYEDYPLPVGYNQTISQPYIVAYMTEALELKGREKVLEIGTGSGYQTAVLAELAGEVFTVERIENLLTDAKAKLMAIGYKNIHFSVGDGTLGWEAHAPYDAIIVTAAGPEVPKPLVEQLVEGGRLVVPVGRRFSQRLVRIYKEKYSYREQPLMGVRFVDLVGLYGWPEK
jgi:protein-L-isoaspartate(D-aspartate) O-methyltransferase